MSKLFGNSRSSSHAAGAYSRDFQPSESDYQQPPLRQAPPPRDQALAYRDLSRETSPLQEDLFRAKTKRAEPSAAPRRPAEPLFTPEPVDQTPVRTRKKRRSAGRRLLTAILLLAGLYGFVVWAPVPIVRRLRNMYIETALSTMNHQWLATAFFPKSVINEVDAQMVQAQQSQNGLNSIWSVGLDGNPEIPQIPELAEGETAVISADDPCAKAFFQLFWELNPQETLAWLSEHPELLAEGWAHLSVNRSGLDQDGLPIHTVQGEQVLAIDAYQQTLLVRVKGTGYRGVLAICKDPARLSLQPSDQAGVMGQQAGGIARDHNGLIGFTGSGFIDEGGHGKGGEITGFALCGGKSYGTHFGSGYKRIELRQDHRLYVTDAPGEVSAQATDAMEFKPALIVDGNIVVDETCGWTAVNPRACLGQSARLEILMLAIEGRQTASLGTDVIVCAEILAQHDCMQAMNMDGGTSAMLWYDGAPVIRCSNSKLPEGRYLPNAWVIERRG